MDDMNNMSDGGQDDSQGTVDTGNESGGEQGGEQGGQYIPKQRFDQVYAQAQAWKELGMSPQEAKQALSEYREWQRQLQEYQRSQQMQRQRTPESDERETIRKRLLEVYPELEQLGEIDQMRQAAMSAYAEKASGYLSNKLTEAGIKLNPQEQDDFEDLLLAKMSPEEFEQFTKGDLAVVDGVLARVQKGGIYGRFRPTPPRPPMRMGPGGKAPGQAPGKPKSFDEAGDVAWERFQQGQKS